MKEKKRCFSAKQLNIVFQPQKLSQSFSLLAVVFYYFPQNFLVIKLISQDPAFVLLHLLMLWKSDILETHLRLQSEGDEEWEEECVCRRRTILPPLSFYLCSGFHCPHNWIGRLCSLSSIIKSVSFQNRRCSDINTVLGSESWWKCNKVPGAEGKNVRVLQNQQSIDSTNL